MLIFYSRRYQRAGSHQRVKPECYEKATPPLILFLFSFFLYSVLLASLLGSAYEGGKDQLLKEFHEIPPNLVKVG